MAMSIIIVRTIAVKLYNLWDEEFRLRKKLNCLFVTSCVIEVVWA
jgi:hypothetical protein